MLQKYGTNTLPRPRRHGRGLGLALVLAGGATAAGEPPADAARETRPDKSRYHLLRPVPRDLLRPLSTDRPDQTESPRTVDAGRFQWEMDLVSPTFDWDPSGGADTRSELWPVAPINLKVGLLNTVDLQLVLEPYVLSRRENRRTGSLQEESGFGELQTRLKINLWGNDGGCTALGLLPTVTWPLPESGLRNPRTEGGILVPFEWECADGWEIGLMTGVGFVSAGADRSGYETEFINSVTLGRELTGRLGVYLELFTVTGTAPGTRWQGQLDVGWTYLLGTNVQVDLGCNFGITDAAPDYNPFLGLSVRF